MKIVDKFSVKADILANVPGKEMIKIKWGLKFYEMIKPLITFFQNVLLQAGTFRLQSKGLYLKDLVHFWVKISKNDKKNNAFNLENVNL